MLCSQLAFTCSSEKWHELRGLVGYILVEKPTLPHQGNLTLEGEHVWQVYYKTEYFEYLIRMAKDGEKSPLIEQS